MESTSNDSNTKEFGPPTYYDILVPPFIGLFTMISGLMILSCCKQPLWWKYRLQQRKKTNSNGRPKTTNKNGVKAAFRDEVISALFTTEELSVLNNFRMFQNNPWAIMKLAFPALLSVGLCPVTIILQPTMIDFFYPESIGGRVNTNDSLAVFLLPAGLVYAMAFGFALQDALAKFDVTNNNAGRHLTILRQSRHLVCMSKVLKAEQKCFILKQLSKSTLCWMDQQMKCKKDKGENLMQILDMLQSCQNCNAIQEKLIGEICEKVLELEGLSHEGYTGADANINILQWGFMEMLGFVAFFGILLTVAESYRLELVMCILTVFSISAFVYILGDLDYAYHGTFSVDLNVFVDFLQDLEAQYKAISTNNEETKNAVLNL